MKYVVDLADRPGPTPGVCLTLSTGPEHTLLHVANVNTDAAVVSNPPLTANDVALSIMIKKILFASSPAFSTSMHHIKTGSCME